MGDKKKLIEFIKKVNDLEEEYGLEIVAETPVHGVYIRDIKEDKHYDWCAEEV